MKIAVLYNRESQKVIDLFGVANREKHGLAAIRRIVDVPKRGGHHTIALEGDNDLIVKPKNETVILIRQYAHEEGVLKMPPVGALIETPSAIRFLDGDK